MEKVTKAIATTIIYGVIIDVENEKVQREAVRVVGKLNDKQAEKVFKEAFKDFENNENFMVVFKSKNVVVATYEISLEDFVCYGKEVIKDDYLTP